MNQGKHEGDGCETGGHRQVNQSQHRIQPGYWWKIQRTHR
jgi:hypothetical protein